MYAKDLFKINRNSSRLNEGLERTFGKKINLENFDLEKLQDARNKIRTQLSQIRSNAGFNENLENDAYHQAQFMLDALNAEISEREEIVVLDSADENTEVQEEFDEFNEFEDDNEFESIEQGEDMRKVTEGEIQQASAIVTAKTMVDRVGRWIEELSGMENDTLLTLGDSIRDEMGQEQAKAFIEAAAPAIQQALENLKATREALSTSMRVLTGEQQPEQMLGGQDDAGTEAGADMGADMQEPAADAAVEEPADDEFGAADAAVGGAEAAGREQRESIQYQNRLLRVLAG
jgi:hypothetical protein